MKKRTPTPNAPLAMRHPIRAVARLTGLGADTLRAWERRHGAIAPVRDDRGRLYSDADVARLRLLRDVVERGHSIGQVAALDEDALRALVASSAAPAAATRAAGAERQSLDRIDLEGLMAAVETFDSAGLERELGRAAALLRPAELLSLVLLPLLTRVGDDWHAGRGTIAHEHFVSACVRNVLGTVLRAQPHHEGTSRLLFATPSGERHEFGTIGAALLAAASGLAVVHLGADLPAGEIVSSAAAGGVDGVVLGVTGAADDAGPAGVLAAVAAALPPDTELWIGGPAAARLAEPLGARAVAITSYADFESHIERVGGRL